MTIRDPERRVNIKRLEKLARENVRGFEASHRVALLKAIGSLALLQLLPALVCGLGVAGLFWMRGLAWLDWLLVLLGGWLTVQIARCWVFDFSEHRALSMERGTHALLFKDINEIRQRIGAPKFSRIEFDMDLNAGVSQRPRLFGLLGSRSILRIGFPLIFFLNRSEFKAVLAHEIAHVSRRHSLRRRWTLLVHASIVNLYVRFGGEKPGLVGALLLIWLYRSMPDLLDHGLVAQRLHEFEADRLAAEAFGTELCAKALVKISALAAIYEENLQDSIRDRMRSSNFVNVRMLEEFRKHVDTAVSRPVHLKEQLRIELMRESELTSSHPSLCERLENLGAQWQGEVDLSTGAAEEYFGRTHKQIREEIDGLWVATMQEHWRSRHDHFKSIENKLSLARRQKESGEKLRGYELFNLAALTEELCGKQQGLSAYTEFHTAFPHLHEGRFHHGRLLLANNDERGLQVMGGLINTDPVYREEGLCLIKAFYQRKYSAEGIRWCNEQLEAFYREMEDVYEDRFKYRKSDELSLHGLSEAEQEKIYRLCGEFPGVQRVSIVKKTVKHYAGSPFYLLVVQFNRSASTEAQRRIILNNLSIAFELPGGCMPVNAGRCSHLRRRLRGAPLAGAKIYDRRDG